MIANVESRIEPDESQDDVDMGGLSDDTIVIDTDDVDGDDVGDLSMELNVEELVAKLDATDDDDLCQKRLIRRRIEALREEREAMKDIDSTYNFSFDDD